MHVSPAMHVLLIRIATFTRLVEDAARLWWRSGLWYAGVDLASISNYVNGGLPRGWSHIYLTGAGRESSPRAGTSSLGREVYILGTSESDAVFAGRAGGGCDDILGLGKVGRAEVVLIRLRAGTD
jgi:hypothetical protein